VPVSNLSAVRIFVDDLAAAAGFYDRLLGAPMVAEPDQGFLVYRCGPAQVVIERVDASAEAEDRALVGRFSGVSFAVGDIVTACDGLRADGIKVSGAPARQFWGGWLATLTDPAGNQVQLVQYPPD
jgi:catechol 2,3-dioxygenase-like lactoylglutathione lyase family enzyme